MIADSVVNDAHIGGKIRGTFSTVRVEKEQSIVYSRENASGHSPIDNLEVDSFGLDIVDILRVVLSAYGCLHADKLIGMFDYISDIAPLIYACKFTVGGVCSVHDDCGHCPHASECSIIPIKRLFFYIQNLK